MDISDKIKKRGFSPPVLPSERVLIEMYRASRKTIRKALKILEQKGEIETNSGRLRTIIPAEKIMLGPKTKVIRCLVTRWSEYYTIVLNIINTMIKQRGYVPDFHFQKSDCSYDENMFAKETMDGAILVGIMNDEIISRIRQKIHPRPMVLINHTTNLRVDTATPYSLAAGFMAGEHLAKSGHKNIGAIFKDMPEDRNFRHSFEGFKEALISHGMECNNNICLWATDNLIPHNKLDIFFDKNKFTGIFVSSYCAHGEVVCGYLESRRKTIPNDVSVIGCDDIDIKIGNKSIALDVVRTDWKTITKLAVNRLFDLIDKASDAGCIRFLVHPSLVIRGSVKNQ